MQLKNKTTKLISFLLIILILLPSILFFFPKKGYAVWVSGIDPAATAPNAAQVGTGAVTASTNTSMLGLKLKDVAIEVGKELLKAVARRVLAEITKSTINWINSGFHGSPLFLENPQSFFNDIAKSELKTIVETYGYDQLLYPFGKQFALNAIASYKSQLSTNSQYTLGKVLTNATLFRNSFNYGGWNGFLINTQYPQNNYLGFNMLATEELARRLQGTVQTAAQRQQTLLQQGMGFLSPQKCTTNESFNNGSNEFSQPSFDSAAYNKAHPLPYDENVSSVSAEQDNAAQQWQNDRDSAKLEWEEKNTCPKKKDGTSGFENTTPGSVASGLITKALGASQDQASYSAMVGNSLSAIFDALLNKFLGDGLNALASTTNPAPVTDDWSYNGQTLGSPAETGTNQAWNWGPEQPIVLDDFKQMVNDAIGSVSTELKLMYNDVPTDPGLYQMYSKIWPKAQELDACIPGPDIVGLKERMDAEVNRASNSVQDKASGSLFGSDQTDEANEIIKELTFAMKLFKDWVDNKMMPELPSSLVYMDSVNNMTTLSQDMSQLNDNRIAKNRALVRLQAIKTNLNTITTQPTPGGGEDKILVSIWKQYQAGNADFSNTNTIENIRNKLSGAKDIYNNLVDSMDPNNPLGCPAQRTAKGWSNPGGPSGVFISSGQTEEALFCSLPINGGYSHGSFSNSSVTYPEIPLVNGGKLNYETITLSSLGRSIGRSFTIGGGLFYAGGLMEDATWRTEISCNNIFNARATEYKGDLPGTLMDAPLIAGESLGNCKYSNEVIETNKTRNECAQNSGTFGPLLPLGTCMVPIPKATSTQDLSVPDTTPVQTFRVPNTLQADCIAKNGTWTKNNQ